MLKQCDLPHNQSNCVRMYGCWVYITVHSFLVCPSHSLPCRTVPTGLLVLWRLGPLVAPSLHFQPRFANRKGHVFWTVSTTPPFWPFAFSSQPPTDSPPSALSSVGRYRGPMWLWNCPPSSFGRGKGPRDRAVNSIRRAVCSIRHP